LDLEKIHRFLFQSYWARGIPLTTVQKSISHSLNFGLYLTETTDARSQIGFARVVSDFSTFAYLGDVYVEPSHRGLGLSRWLLECIMAHPELQGLRRLCLGTKDAQGLYAKFGFAVHPQPENWMEIKNSDIYLRSQD
jgi:GNAT superfamily N-acetyltransferase